MKLSDLAARLEAKDLRPKRNGAGFTSLCPAHDDHIPSLSVREGSEGRLLIHCHAGCETQVILRELGIETQDLFLEGCPSEQGSETIAEYDYRDEAGNLLYQVLRLTPKGFRQRRPDGKGGWDWSVNGVTRVLYRLPEVAGCAREGGLVVVVEGEKDADRLASLGFTATTLSGGANAPWHSSYAESLSGARVVIVPDNDVPGRAHAAKIAEGLQSAGIPHATVELPGLPSGGDVSDWLKTGTAQRLNELLKDSFASRTPPTTSELLAEIEETLQRFVVFPSGRRNACTDAVSLWVLHTWVYGQFEVTPYLSITSPMKRSGKSRLLEVLHELVRLPWGPIATPSEAVVYRKIDKEHPTMLLDEVDTIFGNKGNGQYEGLRALLNGGFRKGTTVPRCVDKGSDVQDFCVYCPKVLAGIGQLPDTVADRSIDIRLERKKRSEGVERFHIRDTEDELEPLREKVKIWASGLDLSTARPNLPDQLDDRAQDCWEPLLAIADDAGGDWPERARFAALVLSGGRNDVDDSQGVRLLEDIRCAFADKEKVSTKDLVDTLNKVEEAPWSSWNGGLGISPRDLARQLKPFHIKSETVRIGERTPKGYHRASFQDAWERYLPPEAQQAQQPSICRENVAA